MHSLHQWRTPACGGSLRTRRLEDGARVALAVRAALQQRVQQLACAPTVFQAAARRRNAHHAVRAPSRSRSVTMYTLSPSACARTWKENMSAFAPPSVRATIVRRAARGCRTYEVLAQPQQRRAAAAAQVRRTRRVDGACRAARTGRSPSARAAPSARPPRASAAPRPAAPMAPTTACAPAPRPPAGATALRASGTRGTLPSCSSLTHGSAAVTRRREARARTSRCAVGLAPAAGTRMIFTAASVLVALCTAWTTTA